MITNFSDHDQKQLDVVLRRFMTGEHLSALSCLNEGVSPSSFNRIYKWLKDGTYTGGRRYVFKEYWSKTNPDGSKKKGAYKLRILIGEIHNAENPVVIPIQLGLKI